MTPRIVRHRIAASAAFACAFLNGAAGRGVAALDPIINDQVVVRLQPGQSIDVLIASYPQFALSPIAGRQIPSFGIHLLQIGAPTALEDEVALALGVDSRVAWAEPNYFGDAPEGSGQTFYFSEVTVPDVFITQPAFGEIGLNGAQFGQPGATTQTVAVIDTGLDVSHPIVAGNVLPGLNLLDLTSDIAEVGYGVDVDGDGRVDELLGHGTHVSTLIEQIAPGCDLLPILAFDSEGNGDNFVMAQAIFAAVERGASVINVSAGSTYNSRVLEAAVDAARAAGAVVIAAAGNMNRQDPQEYPATDPQAIGVAALDGAGRAAFSNFHPQVDVSAPGSAIYGGLPGGTFAAWNGTSFATPMVSGVAARVMERHPEWAAAQYRADNVQTILYDTATNIDAANPAYIGRLGGGLLNADAALFEPPAFNNAQVLASSGAPAALAVGDVDRDGDADLAVLNSAPSGVRVWINNGAGSFAAGPQLAISGNTDLLLIADFNGDLAPDLVVNGNGGSLRLFRNNGTGGFLPAILVAVGADVSAMAAADIDLDGAVDLVVATDDVGDFVRVLRNTGGGTFSAQPWMPVGVRPVSIALARLDADPRLDIATANRNEDSISVLRSVGSGLAFMPAVNYPAGGADPRSVVAVDLDADGATDLVVGNGTGRSVCVRWNDGAGGFSQSPLVRPMPGSRGVQYLMAGDVTCDGREDVVIASGETTEGFASALISRGNRAPIGVIDWETGAQPESGALVDLDGDGVLDVATANVVSNNVTGLINRSCTAAGDMNCDRGATLGDIGGFVHALIDPARYREEYPHCRMRNADINGDGVTNVADIGGFVDLLTRR